MKIVPKLEISVSRKPKKPIRIGGKNGRILFMDESFNPIPAIPENSSDSTENEDAFSASTKSSKLVRDRTNSVTGSSKTRDFFETHSSSGQFSESDDDYWSSKMPRSQNSGNNPRLTRLETDSLSSFTSSTGRRSLSPTLSSSDHERSLTTYQTIRQDYFDPKNIYSQAPIYYIRPAFNKRVPTPKPKTFPDFNFDDFMLTTNSRSSSKSRTKTDTETEINENSNWVLLPAAWGSAVQVVLDPLEVPIESGQAKNSGLGHWIKLKRTLT